ncbi:MAG: Fic family protein [Candidatus Methanoplasma sp.]|nr:Fic family protein [Candidatus Methanoplasma sp.]
MSGPLCRFSGGVCSWACRKPSRRAKESYVHPSIKISVMHYEIEFIHPSMDGNGRMWQTVVLSKRGPLFLSLPTETVIRER